MRDKERIKRLKGYDVNVAKERLGKVAAELEEAGGIRESQSLYTIIYKLEEWQRK